MFLKLAGCAMILGASSFLGFSLANEYVKRQQELKQLQELMHMLETEIRYMSNLLADAFEKITEDKDTAMALFFRESASILRSESGTGASDAWKRAVTKYSGKTALDKEDEKVLLTFGSMLGNSDTEGQLKNIKLMISRLAEREQNACEKRKKGEPMCRKLGVLAGIAVVVLLF